jgi:hypothetical protein
VGCIEINIGDLGDVMNFKNEKSLYRRTTLQRINDIKRVNNINMEKNNKNTKETFNNFWVARVIRLTQKEKMKVEINKKYKDFMDITTLEEICNKVELNDLEEEEIIE